MRILPYVPALCLLGMAAVFLALGFTAKRQAARLEAEGVSVPGVISQAELQTGSKGKKRHILRVTWGEGGAKREGQPFVVTRAFFSERVREDGAVSDPNVTLRHLPGGQENAILVGGTSDLGGMEYLGFAFAGLGGFVAIRTLLRRRLQ
jgi:hypothetical protein